MLLMSWSSISEERRLIVVESPLIFFQQGRVLELSEDHIQRDRVDAKDLLIPCTPYITDVLLQKFSWKNLSSTGHIIQYENSCALVLKLTELP